MPKTEEDFYRDLVGQNLKEIESRKNFLGKVKKWPANSAYYVDDIPFKMETYRNWPFKKVITIYNVWTYPEKKSCPDFYWVEVKTTFFKWNFSWRKEFLHVDKIKP